MNDDPAAKVDILDIINSTIDDGVKVVKIDYNGVPGMLKLEKPPGLEFMDAWVIHDSDLALMLGERYVMGIGTFFARLISSCDNFELPIRGLNISPAFEITSKGGNIDALISDLLNK